jgi:sugar phosphate isomerase/epimerase
MIIGAMNNPHRELVSEVNLFGDMSFDYLELTIEAPMANPERVRAKKKKLQDALASYNFGLVAHLPWYFNLAHPYPRIQKAIDAEFQEAISLACDLGAKKITLHPEFLPNLSMTREEMAEKSIAKVISLHEKACAGGSELLLENFEGRNFAISDFKTLFSKCKMGMTLDVGHASTAGSEGVDAFIAAFKSRIKHIHLHDNLGKNDDHLPLGAGKLGIKKIAGKLKNFYDGTITLEVHSQERIHLKSSRDLLEIWWYGKKKFLDNQKYLFPEE